MLRKRIEEDLKTALKSRDGLKVSTLRFLKAALSNAEIDKKKELEDDEIVAIIKKQVKQRKDSIEEFKKGNRQDLIDKETKELEILNTYLPEELKPDELLSIVREAVSASGASSLRDMGRVMKDAMAKIKGRADGKLVSDMVKKELSKSAAAGNESDSGEAKE